MKIKENSFFKLIIAATLLQGLRSQLQDTFYSEEVHLSNTGAGNFQKIPTKLIRDDFRHREDAGKPKW